MAMNMNYLVSCFGTSLRGFFEFCEEQNGVKADDLNNLFNQYFAINGSEGTGTAEATKAKPAKKAPAKKAKKAKKTVKSVELLSDSDSDEDTSVSSKEAPAPKAPAKKPTARKPSGKGKDAKPRDEQTSVTGLDLLKKKLPDLKGYSRERGLPVSGTKAQLIENLLNYEKEQEGAEAKQEGAEAKLDSEDEDLRIQIKKPKTKGKKVCEPADKPKYVIEHKHGVDMINSSKLDGWFVLNNNNVVVGWVHSDDEANAEVDEDVEIHALDKHVCEVAKELGLEFEVPENMDV